MRVLTDAASITVVDDVTALISVQTVADEDRQLAAEAVGWCDRQAELGFPPSGEQAVELARLRAGVDLHDGDGRVAATWARSALHSWTRTRLTRD